MKIFVAIPVYNRKKVTQRCLEAINKQTYKDFKVVVCDDGSTDGTAEMIRQQFPNVVLLKSDGNLYWSGGYNRCLEYIFSNAHDDNYILLNDDVEFDEDYFSQLVNAAKDNPGTLIMSAAYNKNDRTKLLGLGCDTNPFTLRLCHVKSPADTKYNSINSVCGQDLMPIKLSKKAGFADRKHFLQMGDHDLSFRYQKLGIKAVVSYKARIYTGPSYTVEHYFNDYSFKNFFNYITDPKSAGNLKIRFWAIVKNRPLPLIPVNLFFDINCVIFGYFKRLDIKNK